MKFSTSNIITLLALTATGAVAAPAVNEEGVSPVVETATDSPSDFASIEESFDEEEPFDLSKLLPELFPELAARAKPGCMGGTWKACHDWTLRQCPMRCTGLPRRRHPCTQRCIMGAGIQCQKACS
ncbi:hypothetical protein BB8028_0005g07710 [Beauveria bassiana]|uniref:Uncharacterized protein n=2 Tax=Beauveria bassiana TaxID=176275 RepID=A0A0A2VQM5_BEABA|nr:hypothetical protein BBAD15_g4736 [Beauveria bassiana D1-5]PQK15257.1 hypothetical protein BB8028_0005g07710 [Beauveria bassiana]